MSAPDRIPAAWRMEAMCAAVGLPSDCPGPRHAGMSEVCAACTKGADCLLWRIEGTPEAGHAPDYCLNAEEIEALAAA